MSAGGGAAGTGTGGVGGGAAGPGVGGLGGTVGPGYRIEVMHGANLNMLDRRDPSHYGDERGQALSLLALERKIEGFARELGMRARFFQSNSETEMIERLHRLRGESDAILINAGAWTHYAWAIRDALEIAALPTAEVHLSDVESRESWRRISVFDGLCVAKVSGKGPDGYRDALEALKRALDEA